jgi:hypothetical protein
VGPRDLRRAVRDDIREVLGDEALRGDRLLEAIAVLGPRHSVEPFRSTLGYTVSLDSPEPEARATVAAIERHREAIEALLRRDPGFIVAAFDLLHEMERTLRDPVFRDEEPVPAGNLRAPERFEEARDLESRRAERTGRSMAVVVLSPDRPGGLSGPAQGAGLAALRDGLREVDLLMESPLEDFVVLLPCTGGREGLRAADRFRRRLRDATGVSFRAGVAASPGRSADAELLTRLAWRAMQEARRTDAGIVRHRPERRAHARRGTGGGLSARLRNAGVESEIGVEDLSLGGALLTTPRRVDPGSEVILALRGSGIRPAGYLIPSRVLRVLDGPTPGQAPWRAAVGFHPEARLRVAALLAGLEAPRVGETT